jgi:hypothetical protein
MNGERPPQLAASFICSSALDVCSWALNGHGAANEINRLDRKFDHFASQIYRAGKRLGKARYMQIRFVPLTRA